jgi:PPOX class probable F420-dependent enzyme
MTPAEVDAFLHERQTMNVATFNHDGSIHLVAMWYGFVDGLPVFETHPRSQKALNLRRDPRLTCLVEDGDTFETLRGVELVGSAEVSDDRELVVAAARSVVDRYFPDVAAADVDAMAEGLAGSRVAITVRAERVVSWDHRKLGAP